MTGVDCVYRERGPPGWGWVGGVSGHWTQKREETIKKTPVKEVCSICSTCVLFLNSGDDVIIIDDEEVEKTEVLVSSSEEEVVVLTQADIGGFTKPEPSPTREGEGGRRGMRGKRGGRTTPRGPGATETSAERGRGRNKRKKNRKKQQN